LSEGWWRTVGNKLFLP